MPILPSATIKVHESTVVHQTVLSFDGRRGNLKQNSFPISPPRSRASSAAPFPCSVETSKCGRRFCDKREIWDLEIQTSAVRKVSLLILSLRPSCLSQLRRRLASLHSATFRSKTIFAQHTRYSYSRLSLARVSFETKRLLICRAVVDSLQFAANLLSNSI